jgi:hypothetical protein
MRRARAKGGNNGALTAGQEFELFSVTSACPKMDTRACLSCLLQPRGQQSSERHATQSVPSFGSSFSHTLLDTPLCAASSSNT